MHGICADSGAVRGVQAGPTCFRTLSALITRYLLATIQEDAYGSRRLCAPLLGVRGLAQSSGAPYDARLNRDFHDLQT